VTERERSGASALNYLVAFSAQAVAALAAGRLLAHFGYGVVLAGSALLAAGAAGLFQAFVQFARGGASRGPLDCRQYLLMVPFEREPRTPLFSCRFGQPRQSFLRTRQELDRHRRHLRHRVRQHAGQAGCHFRNPAGGKCNHWHAGHVRLRNHSRGRLGAGGWHQQ